MKEIPLTKGKIALVDDYDFDYLNNWSWYAYKNGNNWYAARRTAPPEQRVILMHRQTLGFPNYEVDHINRNGLDNRRSNLRPATKSLNALNCRVRADSKTRITGVCWHKRLKRWRAFVTVNKKQTSRYFVSKDDAINCANKMREAYR